MEIRSLDNFSELSVFSYIICCWPRISFKSFSTSESSGVSSECSVASLATNGGSALSLHTCIWSSSCASAPDHKQSLFLCLQKHANNIISLKHDMSGNWSFNSNPSSGHTFRPSSPFGTDCKNRSTQSLHTLRKEKKNFEIDFPTNILYKNLI